MPKSGKLQINIHQIDQSAFGSVSFDDVTDIIIEKANKGESEKNKFKLQGLASNDYPGFNIKVFHAIKTKTPKWRSFFSQVVDINSDLSKSVNSFSVYLAFIGTASNIYAISGGSGNFILHQHSVSNLGTEVLTRIIKKDEKVIRALKDRSFTGNVLGQSKQFKGDQRLTDEDQFGKIYNLVKADLDRKILSRVFGFSKHELKRKTSGCIAHASFQINKRIDFNKLLDIVSRIDRIFEEKKVPNFYLNDVIHIDKRHPANQALREKLDLALKDAIFSKYINHKTLDYDFCHVNYEDYYSASEYTARRGGVTIKTYDEHIEIEELLRDVNREGFLLFDTLEHFMGSFLDIQIETFDSDGERLTSATVFNHFNGELKFDGLTYFYLGCEWYRIKSEFISELNKDCKLTLKKSAGNHLLPGAFAGRSEDEFVAKYFDKPDHLVLHKVLHQNIELCDLLIYADETINLIHIKQGFDNSVRELASQISLAAKRLIVDIKSDYSFIKSVEVKLMTLKKSKNDYFKKIASQKIPLSGLVTLFKSINSERQICFCMAIVDHAKGVRSIFENIEAFDSNIAKHSILELRKVLSSYDFGFKVIQISK